MSVICSLMLLRSSLFSISLIKSIPRLLPQEAQLSDRAPPANL